MFKLYPLNRSPRAALAFHWSKQFLPGYLSISLPFFEMNILTNLSNQIHRKPILLTFRNLLHLKETDEYCCGLYLFVFLGLFYLFYRFPGSFWTVSRWRFFSSYLIFPSFIFHFSKRIYWVLRFVQCLNWIDVDSFTFWRTQSYSLRH